MNILYKTSKNYLLLILISILIIGCSKITQTNFNKVETDMDIQKVISILGKPSSADSLNVAGISGTSAVWRNKNIEINIQFINNKVKIKSFNKLENTTNKE
ncbi:hypothetical protein N9L02_01145 [Gammaproteobacteria bacterium]|nr:hypothetical protein [Gammaproteobacteria bacterium]